LLEEGLAVLVILFVCSNLLQVSLGEGVELFLDLLNVYVVVALNGPTFKMRPTSRRTSMGRIR
jgi:hypothetical protein